MRTLSFALLLCLVFLIGCSGIQERKQERVSSYDSLPISARQLLDAGRIALGMDTNAVYIAWGPPSAVIENPIPAASETIWTYYGSRVVHLPYWTYRPSGRGYWSLEHTTAHYAQKDTKAEVVFQNGRVVDWRRF